MTCTSSDRYSRSRNRPSVRGPLLVRQTKVADVAWLHGPSKVLRTTAISPESSNRGFRRIRLGASELRGRSTGNGELAR